MPRLIDYWNFIGTLLEFQQKSNKNVRFCIKKALKSPILSDLERLAGETRFEHATYGFGDRYSTVEPLPYSLIIL